jgi:hypothetical protein
VRALDQSTTTDAVDINRNIKLALQLAIEEAKRHFMLNDGVGLVLSKPQLAHPAQHCMSVGRAHARSHPRIPLAASQFTRFGTLWK